MKIIGANRDDANIEITLPIDESGEYAFDGKGKPVKGVTPVVLRFPRYDCLSREEFKQMQERLEAIGEDTPVDERIYTEIQAMMQDFVTPEDLEAVEKLKLAEVKQIAEHIREVNQMSLGEFVASTRS